MPNWIKLIRHAFTHQGNSWDELELRDNPVTSYTDTNLAYIRGREAKQYSRQFDGATQIQENIFSSASVDGDIAYELKDTVSNIAYLRYLRNVQLLLMLNLATNDAVKINKDCSIEAKRIIELSGWYELGNRPSIAKKASDDWFVIANLNETGSRYEWQMHPLYSAFKVYNRSTDQMYFEITTAANLWLAGTKIQFGSYGQIINLTKWRGGRGALETEDRDEATYFIFRNSKWKDIGWCCGWSGTNLAFIIWDLKSRVRLWAIDGTGKLTVGTVPGARIPDGDISTAKLANSAVTTAKIANLAVTTAKIADLAVTTAKIADLAVTTAKIADKNVTTAKIADSAVTTDKIEDQAIISPKLFLSGFSSYGTFPAGSYTIISSGRSLTAFNPLFEMQRDDFRLSLEHAANTYTGEYDFIVYNRSTANISTYVYAVYIWRLIP